MPRNYVCFNSFDGWAFLNEYFFFHVGRKAAFSIRAVNRMQSLAHVEHDSGDQMRDKIHKFKEESAQVCCVVCCFYETDCFRLIFF